MKQIDSYEAFCRAFRGTSAEADRATVLLHLQNWLNEVADSLADDDMDFGLDEFYISRATPRHTHIRTDILSHILNGVEEALKRIRSNMREKLVRENILMPVHKARELSSYGLNWLSRKPGNTIKEKLSGINSIMAVERRMSLDTGENRLVLAFLRAVGELLEAKVENMPPAVVPEEEIHFYESALRILGSDISCEIGSWENLPPNNTLLSDSQYGKVWRGWSELKKIDYFIKDCNDHLSSYLLTAFYGELVGRAKERLILPQLPIRLEYLDFSLDFVLPEIRGLDSMGNIFTIRREEDCLFLSYKGREFKVTFSGNVLQAFQGDVCIYNSPVKVWDFRRHGDSILLKAGCTAKNAPSKAMVQVTLDSVAVDLFDIRPSYINKDGLVDELPYRLLQQEISVGTGEDVHVYRQSCESSDAILISEGEQTTLRNRIYTVSSAIDDESDEQMKHLFRMLSSRLVTKDFTYLFPDLFDDFRLSLVQKTARLSYSKVRAFPKSIGAVFHYQNCENFHDSFVPGDFVLVVDVVDDDLSFTLVRGVLYETSSVDSTGTPVLMWERHPTFSRNCKENLVPLLDKLQSDGCHTPELLYKIFGVVGLAHEANKLTCFFDSGDPYRISAKTLGILNGFSMPVTEAIEQFISNRNSVIGNAGVHVILANPILSYGGNRPCRYSYGDEVLLGHRCHELMKEIYGTSLWKDHLPDLAIKLLYGKFDLVSQATVLPNFNSVQEIRIPNTFTLVKGRRSYHFDLVQNDMNSKLRYEAVISHSAFPLKENVVCNLRMTYRYGAEEPYELLFVPLNKKQAGFSEVKVQWKRKTDYPYLDLVYPVFPEGRSWAQLAAHPNRDGTETINLVSSLGGYFRDIAVPFYCHTTQELGFTLSQLDGSSTQDPFATTELINGAMETVCFDKRNLVDGYNDRKANFSHISYEVCRRKSPKERLFIDLTEDAYGDIWRENNLGYQCIRKFWYKDEWIKVAFYSSNFVNQEDFNPGLTRIYFDLGWNKSGKYKGYSIVPEEKEAVRHRGEYEARNIRPGCCPRDTLTNRWYQYLFHTVFVSGRSVYEPDCPIELQDRLQLCIPAMLNAYKRCDNGSAKSILFNMMSLMASDIGSAYYEMACEYVISYREQQVKKIKLSDSIGYALGDISTSEQKKLYEHIQTLQLPKIICILSKGIWKHVNLVFNIPAEDVLKYFEGAIDELIRMHSSEPLNKFEKDVSAYIEFLIAVFRLRQLRNAQICRTLSMNHPKVRSLYELTEQIIAEKTPVRTRLRFEIQNKESADHGGIPDLLYVLLMYITGNTADNDIRISGIEE